MTAREFIERYVKCLRRDAFKRIVEEDADGKIAVTSMHGNSSTTTEFWPHWLEEYRDGRYGNYSYQFAFDDMQERIYAREKELLAPFPPELQRIPR